MSKLWLSLGLTSLLAAIGIILDQRLRFGVWWEWEDFLHHENFSGIFICMALILFTVSLVGHSRKPKRE